MPTEPRLPRLSAKEAAILELLVRNGEMYGLELVKASDGRLKRGTVYVTLQRMAEKGFVESRAEEEPGGGGPARRFFTASGLGARVLDARAAYAAALGAGEAFA